MRRILEFGTAILAVASAACGSDFGPADQMTTIAVTPANAALTALGTTRAFMAQAYNSRNQPVSNQPTFTWTSSDPTVATIDAETGVATAVDNGTTTISAAVAGGPSGVTGSTTLAVAQEPSVVVVNPVAPTLRRIGATATFTAQAVDARGYPLSPQPAFTWRSSAVSVATVDGATGIATATGNGTTTVTAAVAGTAGVEASTVLTTEASLTQGEKIALGNALASSDFGGLMSFVVEVVDEVGLLNAATSNTTTRSVADGVPRLSVTGTAAASYESAVGIGIEYTYDLYGEVSSGWFYGVIGWNALDTSTNTVGEWVLVGAFGESGPLPDSFTGTVESGAIVAQYGADGTIYFGTSGTATIGGTFTGGVTDCGSSQQGIIVTCSYVAGAMSGEFAFTAAAVAGGGTYTQAAVEFSRLPAVKMSLAISQSP